MFDITRLMQISESALCIYEKDESTIDYFPNKTLTECTLITENNLLRIDMEYSDSMTEMAFSWMENNISLVESAGPIEKIKSIFARIWEAIKKIGQAIARWVSSFIEKLKSLFSKNKTNTEKAEKAMSNANKHFNNAKNNKVTNETVELLDERYGGPDETFNNYAIASKKSEIPKDKKDVATIVLNPNTIFGDKETRYIKKKFGDLISEQNMIKGFAPIIKSNRLVGVTVGLVNPLAIVDTKTVNSCINNVIDKSVPKYGNIQNYLNGKIKNMSKDELEKQVKEELGLDIWIRPNVGAESNKFLSSYDKNDIDSIIALAEHAIDYSTNSMSLNANFMFGTTTFKDVTDAIRKVYGNIIDDTNIADIGSITKRFNAQAEKYRKDSDKIVQGLTGNSEAIDRITDEQMAAIRTYTAAPPLINMMYNYLLKIVNAGAVYSSRVMQITNAVAQCYCRAVNICS